MYTEKSEYFLTPGTYETYKDKLPQDKGYSDNAMNKINRLKKQFNCERLYAGSPIRIGTEDDPELLEVLKGVK